MSSPPSGADDRAYSVGVLTKIAKPVLVALSENKLRATMPVEVSAQPKDTLPRDRFSYLEAAGRLLCGLAPWLELGPDSTPEGQQRAHYIELAVKSIRNGVDPKSPDFFNFTEDRQPLVDAAFLAHGLLRAPTQLWGNLDAATRANVVAGLKATRAITPIKCNWELFSAMVEAALWKFTGACEMAPIELAVNDHLAWYKGDGVYGDGPVFHWDYYNSFVIQPMLLDVLAVCAEKKHPLNEHHALALRRAQRYAAIQERLISPEATFPIMGRSSVYRFGAFQTLSQLVLAHELPSELSPGGVRVALTALVRRMIEAPGTFDENGWLRLGVAGHQPSQAEHYISTGSLYLCAAGLLQLGLPASDSFWTDPAQPWTQQRLWSGEDLPADHAISE